jgi:pimeloyl-ACP methyl ester carboxylesterase
MRGVLRAALVGAIILTQVATTAKKAPWHIPWDLYARAQHLVDIGGRRLNVICTGAGSPTVILEAGFGADASAWRVAQPRIAQHTRVCSYDRAGMGFSDPAGPPRDAAAIAGDLHSLLRNAHIAPPYVLVGWSSAGLYTLFYADRYRNEVAGLVEVDPTTPYEDTDASVRTIDPEAGQRTRSMYQQFAQCAVTVSEGKCPFFNLAKDRGLLRALGCPHVSPKACAVSLIIAEHEMRSSYWRDEALEWAAVPKSMDEDLAEQRPYGDLPLIVLTDSEQGDISPSGPLSLTQQRAMWRATEKLQERVATLSAVGEHFVVARSSHAIQLDQPAAVISAVDEVVDQARYNAQAKGGHR